MRLFAGRKWLVVLIVVLAIVLLVVTCNRTGSGVRVTISKETTYITKPLRPDGYPDYVAALNEQFSRGVTPENNSAVLFWQAVGPSEIPSDCREKYFHMLGIEPLPETGDYFVTSHAHIAAQVAHRTDNFEEKLREQLEQVMKRPWSKREFPVWAEWLAVNDKPLALLVEASKRPRRYDPLIGEMAIGVLLPGPQASRDVARSLVARAMLRTREGKVEEAWQDLLACHRLARLVGQGPTIVEGLVAITLDGIARRGDARLLESDKLTTARIAGIRKDLASLPPIPKMANQIDQAERLLFLDCVATIARKGPGSLSDIFGGSKESKGMVESTITSLGVACVDWDISLRMGNMWYDRLVEASRRPTHRERKETNEKVNEAIRELAQSVKDLKSLGLSLFTGPRQAISERVGRILVGLLLPAVSAAVEAEDRSLMETQLTDLAFALAAYRVDHGSYPAKLADLVPKYVSAVPKDMFNEAELHYKRQSGGYLLYSVGPNGIDDGGKYSDAGTGSTRQDDLIIRIPSDEKRP